MKKFIIPAALFCLLSVNAFAQTMPDYSGEWALDKNASKLSGKMANIESMTITVTQRGSELTAATVSKRVSFPQGSEEPVTYNLMGGEIKTDMNISNAAGTIKTRGRSEGGKLNLKAERNIKTQVGNYSVVTRETWELSADGATLKIKRETETPQDTMSADMVFTKKAAK
jgi:hypothetical protein